MTGPQRFIRRLTATEISSADLLRECGRRSTDPALWQTFMERFHSQITTYVIRTIRARQEPVDADLVCDLVQEVYVRLLGNRGRALMTFQGETDFSVFAFLGRVAMGIVSDHYRSQAASKRRVAEVLSIEEAQRREEASVADDLDVASILSWIDVERLMGADSDRKNAARNLIIFKLHYVDGFTPTEISQFPVFSLGTSAIREILRGFRRRLKKRTSK